MLNTLKYNNNAYKQKSKPLMWKLNFGKTNSSKSIDDLQAAERGHSKFFHF